jgi:hypothetical protein
LQFLTYVPLGLTDKGCINFPLVFSHLCIERGVQAEGLTQTLIKLAGALIWPWRTSAVYSCSCLFPSFLHAS